MIEGSVEVREGILLSSGGGGTVKRYSYPVMGRYSEKVLLSSSGGGRGRRYSYPVVGEVGSEGTLIQW